MFYKTFVSKKTWFFCLLVLLSFSFVFISQVRAENGLFSRLAGRILLQVEDKGQAYYLDPQINKGIFLNRPSNAFAIMRERGIGITNLDLAKIPISLDFPWTDLDTDGDGLPDNLEVAIGTDSFNVDTDGDSYNDKTELDNSFNPLGSGRLDLDLDFSKKHSGKIFLQVERNGEAWYINPLDNKRYFLGSPLNAFNIMRQLGLGISNEDLAKIEIYNLENQDANENENYSNISTLDPEVLTIDPGLMIDFSVIKTIFAEINNPANKKIIERGILWDYTIFPILDFYPNINNNREKIISSDTSDRFSVNIIGLIPGTYPFVRSYVITEDNKIIYGNVQEIKGASSLGLPKAPMSSAISRFTLNYSAGLNGSITGETSQIVNSGASGSSVSAVPSTGYHFVSWSDASTSNPRTDSDVSGDITVTASFSINVYTLSYSAGSNGSVTGTTTQTVNYGLDGTAVTAVPSSDYYFLEWSDNSTDNPRTDTSISADITVSAIFEPICDSSTVSDADDNVYSAVVIGNQCWMGENLKTTKFSDDSSIPNITTSWQDTVTPTYGWYNNDYATYGSIYGALYNWYAIDSSSNGSKNVCPSGWVIPSTTDWSELFTFAGGTTVAGGKLKATSTTYWDSPNTGATDEFGFTALPGGVKWYTTQAWYSIEQVGQYWASNQYSSSEAYQFAFRYDSARINYDVTAYINKKAGLAVRCIRDLP
ncbi:MAG: FISUMP domain-containing protein [Patescibacteria group bacterium]|jgi:uncharacterized protein (TIGR02145 family)